MHFKILPHHREELWIKACQKGDAAAQRQVYEKFSRKMLGVCFRYVGDQFAAEEVLINGFLKVFDRINQYRNEGSFEGWIRRIMINEALTYLRRNKSIYLETELTQAEYEIDHSSLSQQLEVNDLLALIERLPTGYKTVFNLYAIEGYSHKEIADLMGISESTSKSQLCRARALLQEYLTQNESKVSYY